MASVSKPSYPSKATIARMVDAVQAAGVKVGSVKIGPDGTIHCLPAENGSALSAYDQWKASQKH